MRGRSLFFWDTMGQENPQSCLFSQVCIHLHSGQSYLPKTETQAVLLLRPGHITKKACYLDQKYSCKKLIIQLRNAPLNKQKNEKSRRSENVLCSCQPFPQGSLPESLEDFFPLRSFPLGRREETMHPLPSLMDLSLLSKGQDSISSLPKYWTNDRAWVPEQLGTQYEGHVFSHSFHSSDIMRKGTKPRKMESYSKPLKVPEDWFLYHLC